MSLMSNDEIERFALLMGMSREQVMRAQLAALSAQLTAMQDRLTASRQAAGQALPAEEAERLRTAFGLSPEQFAAAGKRA